MKCFIPFEDDSSDQFFDQLQPDDRLVPWQTAWMDYIVIEPESAAVATADAGLIHHPLQSPIDEPGQH